MVEHRTTALLMTRILLSTSACLEKIDKLNYCIRRGVMFSSALVQLLAGLQKTPVFTKYGG